MQNDFRIGETHDVEPSLNRVTGPDGSTRLEPKVMQVLLYLVEHAGQVVTKDRLMASVWADTAVGDDVLTRAVSELRRLFGDGAKHPRVIETFPKGGYRLIASVTRQDDAREPPPLARDRWPRRGPLAAASTAVLVLGAVAAVWLSRRQATDVRGSPPVRVVQLTAVSRIGTLAGFLP